MSKSRILISLVYSHHYFLLEWSNSVALFQNHSTTGGFQIQFHHQLARHHRRLLQSVTVSSQQINIVAAERAPPQFYE